MGGSIMASTINAKNTSTGVVITPDSSGQLELQTADTTRMTIDVNGNVGIGTSSPAQKLEINTNANSQTWIGLRNLNSGSGSSIGFLFGNNGSNAYGSMFIGSTAYSSFGGANSINIGTYAAYPIVFFNNNAESMRIDSSNKVWVGGTGPLSDSNFGVYGNIAATGGYKCHAGSAAGTTFGNTYNINWTGSPQLWIDSTNVGTFAFTSDYRVKKNIQSNVTLALDRIEKIRPVTYEFSDYGELFKADGVQREGFIAHELAEVIPSAVEGEKDAENQIQSLKLDALCSVMVKAIQEQQELIKQLQADVATLKGAA